MKFLTLLIACVLFMQSNVSFANVTKQAQIEYAFNKFRYELEVSGANAAQGEIMAQSVVNDLIAAGTTGAEIMEYVQSNLKSAQARVELAQLVNTMKIQNLSQEEMVSKLTGFFSSLEQEGASHRGRTRVIVHISWPIALIVTTLVIIDAVTCINCGPRYRY